MSESQERMCAVVAPEQARRVHGGLPQVGRRGRRDRRGERLRTPHHRVARRPDRRRAAEDGRPRGPGLPASVTRGRQWQDALQADAPTSLPRPASGDELRQTLLQLLASPNLASKSWVTDQYDRYVLGNTVLAQPEDSGVVRIADDGLGVAVSTDGNGRYGKLDPYVGRAARARRGLPQRRDHRCASRSRSPTASTSVRPRTPTSCGSSPRPTRGLADACQQLGVPVTGGNVSFYNQTGETAILPTPIIGVLGRDRRRRAAHADGVGRRRRRDLAGRRDALTSSAVRSGRTCRVIWADCRRRSTWSGSVRSPRSPSRRPATDC